MDSISKVKYHVRDLTTRSVTLFPTNAQIFRDIKNVPLQPGTNEITIFGLTPTVDEHSIKVEGSGSAIISEISVESLPNGESFEEIYPDSDDDMPIEAESLDDEEINPSESAELIEAKSQDQSLADEHQLAHEMVSDAKSRQKVLQKYAETFSCEHNVPIEEKMTKYYDLRQNIFRDVMRGEKRKRELDEEIPAVKTRLNRLLASYNVEKTKANAERKKSATALSKVKKAEAHRRQELVNERDRIRNERMKFWPKYCYSVRITLEANSFTPGSSRRTSISSDTQGSAQDFAGPSHLRENEAPGTCNLTISYVTSSAFWTPTYDLQLSLKSAVGSLCFDAQLHNKTSETWEKCKVTLSTSQTTSSTLEKTAPRLVPWRIKSESNGSEDNSDNFLLLSKQEQEFRVKLTQQLHQARTVPGQARGEMFGTENEAARLQNYQMQLMLLEQQNKKRMTMARQEMNRPQGPPAPTTQPAGQAFVHGVPQQMQTNQFNAQRQMQLQVMQQQAIRQQQMLQQQQQIPQQQMQQQQMQQQIPQQQMPQPQMAPQSSDVLNDFDFDAFLGQSDTEHMPALDFEESLVEEMGYTLAYDLPALKTLTPKSNSSRQRIARIKLQNVEFNHTVIAKYEPAAYLSVKFRTTSQSTLLRGPVGVTLDGSFMGRTLIPRSVAAGEPINLSLGIDTAMKISYATPEMKRLTAGYFNKEDAKLYSRVIHIENTRKVGSRHAKMIVRDQIPVSHDDRLRVKLLKTEDMVFGGDGAALSTTGKDGAEEGWGTAEASLKSDGEVCWLAVVRPGKRAKLTLEYSVTAPLGAHAVEA